MVELREKRAYTHIPADRERKLKYNTIQYNTTEVLKAPSKFAEHSSETDTPTTTRALILFIQTLALYKSFTYLLTYYSQVAR